MRRSGGSEDQFLVLLVAIFVPWRARKLSKVETRKHTRRNRFSKNQTLNPKNFNIDLVI